MLDAACGTAPYAGMVVEAGRTYIGVELEAGWRSSSQADEWLDGSGYQHLLLRPGTLVQIKLAGEVTGHVDVARRGAIDLDLLDPLGVARDQHPGADVAVQVAGFRIDLATEQRGAGPSLNRRRTICFLVARNLAMSALTSPAVTPG